MNDVMVNELMRRKHALYDWILVCSVVRGCCGYLLASWSTRSSEELGWIVKSIKQYKICGEKITFNASLGDRDVIRMIPSQMLEIIFLAAKAVLCRRRRFRRTSGGCDCVAVVRFW